MASQTTLTDEARIALDTLAGRLTGLVSPSLRIGVTGGELAAVTVATADGEKVAGTVSDAPAGDRQQVWVPAEPLAYGTTYTLTATARIAALPPSRTAASPTSIGRDDSTRPARLSPRTFK